MFFWVHNAIIHALENERREKMGKNEGDKRAGKSGACWNGLATPLVEGVACLFLKFAMTKWDFLPYLTLY